ncbi:MAG: proton-conducting membrane transporter, partial [Lachnospiraceae bacterium]|nr:proton-conducting membrane transporter [Lachnospiraceae bacterium]
RGLGHLYKSQSLGLMGVPGLAGFISKWNLAAAAVESGNKMAVVGIGCLLVSALLTAMYMLTIVIRAFFPENDFDMDRIKDIKDPDWKMLLPLFVFSFFIIAFGLDSSRIVEFFGNVAAGVY